MIKLYNSLSRTKEDFYPLDPTNVGLYVCGPTVYDKAHVGNARPVVVFDVLFRLLCHVYGEKHVCYVRNITDVDDKINAAAAKNGESIQELTARTTKLYHEDMAALEALPPHIEPKATEHMPEMIAMIEDLLRYGNAYVADGHVLFKVNSYNRYGHLSKRDVDEMQAGARVEVEDYKQDPMDFVLWKPSKPDEPSWDSPWGKGRPGWHIECSAMSTKYLGPTFDIHGGGIDLIFPHHENEIAQSCCANKNSVFSRFFMHNGHITIEGDKMSKSLGNFFTVHDLLEKVPGEVIRLALLQSHYRQPLDWTETGLMQAKQTLDKFYNALRGIDLETIKSQPRNSVVEALSDDLNVPLALSVLHDLAGQLNKADGQEKLNIASQLKASAGLLGLLQQDAESWFQGSQASDDLPSAEIEKLLAERLQARQDKDFQRADAIRDQLKNNGILIDDGPGGSTWRRA